VSYELRASSHEQANAQITWFMSRVFYFLAGKFSQKGDLAGVIGLMLHHAVEHESEIVMRSGFAGDRLVPGCFGKFFYVGDELFVRVAHVSERFSPCRIARVGDGREIFGGGKLCGNTTHAAAHGVVPCGNVEEKFPDAMRVFDGMSSGLRGCDSLKNFEEGVAVPGLAIKGAAQIVGDVAGFGHSSGLRC
jgi:hypothetical protein